MNDVLGARRWVSDGGLETDLLFNHGIDLPHFAAFPLVEDDVGRALLRDYYTDYVRIAAAASAGLVLETPTWRANPDWAARLGYDAARLDAANRRTVELVRGLGAEAEVAAVLVSGVVGPRGDGYVSAGADADEAADYHAAQVGSLAAAGVDVVHAMTITEPAEAIGITRAARAAGVPVAVSFTVETDGRLPDGSPLEAAVAAVDAVGGPNWYGVNCAHPLHVQAAFGAAAATSDSGATGASWTARIRGFRPNASTLSHAELDEMTVLDAGDLDELTTATAALRRSLADVQVLGGCCGTDARHVAALWGQEGRPTP